MVERRIDLAPAPSQNPMPETAIYYTVAVTALFNFMNRLVEGLGIELDPAYVEIASKRLADHGYLPLIAMLR